MERNRERCACFTGHRILSREERAQLRVTLRLELLRLINLGYTTFLAGGALGFDTVAEQEVLRLKNEISEEIKLVLVLPCRDQDLNWHERDSAVFRTLRRSADEVIYTGEEYERGCMFVRNRYMVDHSSACLYFLREGSTKGGTAYTVRYAERKGLKMIDLK